MAITKVTRTLLSTGIDDQSNATAITIDSSENTTFSGSILSNIAGNNSTGGNIRIGLVSDDAAKYNAITSTQYDSGTETEGFTLISAHSTDASTNTINIGGSFGEQNAATSIRLYTAANATTRTGSEKMRIDSSGNLLVGTTDSFPGDGDTNTGVSLTASGSAAFSRSGFRVVSINRNTDDGTLIEFNKNGSEVGSIAAKDGDIALGTGDTGLRFLDGSDAITPHNISTNAGRDNAIDLGTTGARFKDLYLSGGAYLGGTGSANKLDDYEEGTFTPALSGANLGTAIGLYTKIGRQVFIDINIVVSSIAGSSSATDIITGLPFTAGNNGVYSKLATATSGMSWGTNRTQVVFQVRPNSTAIGGVALINDATFADVNAGGFSANDWVTITGSYKI